MAKTALITGATRGLGFAMSEKMAAMGIKVIMACRENASGKKAVAALKSKGLDVVFKKADVAKLADIDRLAKEVKKEFGTIDILVNNAGVNIEPEKTNIQNIDIEKYEKVMDVNVRGLLYMCSRFVPLMKHLPDARIVNFSSGLARLSAPRTGPYPSYSISKTAVNQVTKFLAEELKNTKVKVVSVDPGWVKTDMGGPNAELSIEEGIDTPVWLATAPAKDIESGMFYKDRKPLGW